MARSNLTVRVLSAAVFGPLLTVLFFWGGPALFFCLCVVVAGGAWEFYRMCRVKGLQPWTKFGIAASLAWCLGVFWKGREAMPVLLTGVVLLGLVMALSGESGCRLRNLSTTFFGVIYVGCLGSFGLLVRNFSLPEWSEQGAAIFTVLVLFGIWGSDILAYFLGRWLGRWHPFPNVSPGKTDAGFVGALLGALGVILCGVYAFELLSWAEGVGLGILIGLGAPVGDLVESMMKRDTGVKDASTVIPGHGGILDRFDSLLFVFPLVYLYLLFLKAMG